MAPMWRASRAPRGARREPRGPFAAIVPIASSIARGQHLRRVAPKTLSRARAFEYEDRSPETGDLQETTAIRSISSPPLAKLRDQHTIPRNPSTKRRGAHRIASRPCRRSPHASQNAPRATTTTPGARTVLLRARDRHSEKSIRKSRTRASSTETVRAGSRRRHRREQPAGDETASPPRAGGLLEVSEAEMSRAPDHAHAIHAIRRGRRLEATHDRRISASAANRSAPTLVERKRGVL